MKNKAVPSTPNQKQVVEPGPLTINERSHLEDFLITGLGLESKVIKSLSDDQLRQLVKAKQEEKIERKKNPNGFWIIKGLPLPVLPKPNGPSRHGLYIFLGFVAMLLIFIAILFAVLFTRR